ncbi:hypothetical protein [Ralstonia sp. A12]|uniref:hypothetical protein n=1 Tax=Ralstonia sp. A12 TaxID=1217052 RepID=UPI000A066225|nr:hypothetical protein [Ralstonia sp. A12]
MTPNESSVGRVGALAPSYTPVSHSEHDGVRFLHFAGAERCTQGAILVSEPDRLLLPYVQQMMAWLLFLEPAQLPEPRVVQLGLGPGSLTRFSYRKLPHARVTAVELNPLVIEAARNLFDLPPDDHRLQVLAQDALDWVMDPVHHGAVDALQVDVYDGAHDGSPVLQSEAFYRACRNVLRAPGVMAINLHCSNDDFARNIERICRAFDYRVLIFPVSMVENTVALAFNGPPISVEWAMLQARAETLQSTLGLPTADWIDGLRRVNPHQQGSVLAL